MGAWMKTGAIIIGLTALTALPCLAGARITAPGGGTLTVEAVGLDLAADAGREGTRALSWVLQDAAGIRTGVLPASSDAALDESPMLIADPRSGVPVLIWSHGEAGARKLAWARFETAGWVGVHDLTFGPADDRFPAVGVSSGGAFLFWRRDAGRVFYAPLDLSSGRLFAAPRHLAVSNHGWHGPSIEGGTDAPVILGTCTTTSLQPCLGSGRYPIDPGTVPPPTLDGGSDVPIVQGSATSAVTSVSVAADPSCATMVLALADPADGSTMVVAFSATERASLAARYRPAADASAADAARAATMFFLQKSCR
jgi:hypothetical protein